MTIIEIFKKEFCLYTYLSPVTTVGIQLISRHYNNETLLTNNSKLHIHIYNNNVLSDTNVTCDCFQNVKLVFAESRKDRVNSTKAKSTVKLTLDEVTLSIYNGDVPARSKGNLTFRILLS